MSTSPVSVITKPDPILWHLTNELQDVQDILRNAHLSLHDLLRCTYLPDNGEEMINNLRDLIPQLNTCVYRIRARIAMRELTIEYF